MDQAIFDQLQQTVQAEGPTKAIDKLCDTLRECKDYNSLFYAMLMKKRHELGLSPIPTGPSSEIPASAVDRYEDTIRSAAREVGRLFLEQGDIAGAFHYFRMLNEVGPVAEALEKYELPEGEEAQKIIELAFYHGGNPRRGYQWILQRFGICSAITIMTGALQGGNFPHGAESRDSCLKELARSLFGQLVERIRHDIVRREGKAPETNSITELVAGRDWLFEEDNYHVDVSHLSSVVQLCSQMPKCEELAMVRQMCDYGKHLSSQFQSQGDPPFEGLYLDYGPYYDIILGTNVEEGLAHFRQKADNPDPDSPGQNPAAELLVNLYLQLNRPADALATARKYLSQADERQMSCPNITELCRRVNDYRVLAEVSRERGDPVNFVAGLIAAANPKQPFVGFAHLLPPGDCCMAITFHCPCGQTLQIAEEHAGQKAKCAVCNAVLDVPLYALVFAEANGAAPMTAIPLTSTSNESPAPTDPSQSGLWNQITGEPVAPSAPSGTPGKPYYHLYSPKAVAGAALAGTVLAGAIVLTYNYQLLGQKKPAMIALAGGVLGTAGCFLLLFFMPALLAIPFVMILSGLVAWGAANLAQGEWFRAHREKGGEEASVQSATGLGLLCTALFVVVWFVGYFPFTGHVRTPSVTFGAHGVYYTDGATAEDAERVGKLMEELGHFDTGEQYRGSKYVWVSRKGPAYIVSFLLRDGLWDHPKAIAKCRDIRKQLAEKVFPGQPVEVWMCDGFRKPQLELKD